MKKKPSIFLSVLFIFIVIGNSPGQNVPAEARRFFDRGTAAVEMAKSVEDYEVAIREFKQAITSAPNWADAHFNLGMVHDAAGKPDAAIASLRAYLRLAPNAPDAETVKSRITKIELKKEQEAARQRVFDLLADGARKEVTCKSDRKVAGMGAGGYNILWNFRKIDGRFEVKNMTIDCNDDPEYRNRQACQPGQKEWLPVEIDGNIYRYHWVAWVDIMIGYEVEIISDVRGEVVSTSPPRIRETVISRYGRNFPIDQNPGRTATGKGAEECVFELSDDLLGDGWWTGRNGDVSTATNAGGKYVLDVVKPGYGLDVFSTRSVDSKRDFSIQTEMKFIQGDNTNLFGIAWGAADERNYHFFGITANGHYMYRKLVKGEWVNVISAVRTQTIKQESTPNKITVRKRAGKFEFLINDQLVDSAPFEDFSGRIGFHLNHYMKVEINYLRLNYDP